MAPKENVQQLTGHLFRHEAGKMAAVLTRILGSDRLEVAEDIVQDTLMKAMETWGFKGILKILQPGCMPLQKIKHWISFAAGIGTSRSF